MSAIGASASTSYWPSFETIDSLHQASKAVHDLRDGIKLYDCTQNQQIQVRDAGKDLDARICFLVRPMFFLDGRKAPDDITPVLFESSGSEDSDAWIRTRNPQSNEDKIEYGKAEPFTHIDQTSFVVTQDLLQPNEENIVEFFEYKSPSPDVSFVQGRRWQVKTNSLRSHYPFSCHFASQVS